MKTITINNLSLAYTRRGHGAPLVLIHGYPLDSSIWGEAVPLLEEHFDLIIPDVRGFGGSATTTDMYTMTDLASDIKSLLDELDIPSAFVAGHSMGGYLALALAASYPEQVRGLALVSSQTAADAPEGKQKRYDTAKQIAEQGIGVVVEGMAPKLSADARLQTFARELMAKQKPQAYMGTLMAMAEREDTLSMLAMGTFPLTIVHGDADALIPVAKAREVASVASRAHYVELAGIGHLPMLESPQAVADALMNFL